MFSEQSRTVIENFIFQCLDTEQNSPTRSFNIYRVCITFVITCYYLISKTKQIYLLIMREFNVDDLLMKQHASLLAGYLSK